AQETALRWSRGEVQGGLRPRTFLNIDLYLFMRHHGARASAEWQNIRRVLDKSNGSVGLAIHHLEAAWQQPDLRSLIVDALTNSRIPVVASTDFSGFQLLEARPALAKQVPFIVTTPPDTKTLADKRVLLLGASSFLGESMFRALQKHYR